ncbi:MAG: molybdopterin-dependent oxidoreductase [Candidatus Diapherotrites archaeon]|nr:molybdopterin-dependent oxidoreductase [Candidatus Diapherotrites archaeon]
MDKITIFTIVLVGAFMVLALFLFPAPSEQIKQLQSVEIREYEGENLSSVADFRENSIKGPQTVDISTYRLKVDGLVKTPKEYTYDEVLQNQAYKKIVTLNCVEGWSATLLWEGVLVSDIIKKSEALPEAKTVIFHAVDGYTTSFPIEFIMSNPIIMAYKMNEVILPKERGYPFQLVAEDKWGYKWIKWIERIELSDDVNYKGYWESRGFSDTADLNEPF